MTSDLYSLALTVPWCCTSEALEAILSIAAREPLPEGEIARRMHGPKSLALRNGKRREDSGRMTMHGPIAVIPIDGPIYRYADIFTSVSGGVTTESLARDLALAIDDPSVAAILLAIDSPGGEATGISELSDAIFEARGRKPIAAHIEGYGASAAYWIASAADTVLVDDTALVGSIGTIMGVPDPTKRPSYRIDFVSRQSPKKRPDPNTDQGRAVIQQLVDDLTDVFIAKVARNRALDTAQILAIEGGMLVGQQAIDAGLADALGSEEGTIGQLISGAFPALAERRTIPLLAGPRAAKETNPMPQDQKGFWAGFWGGAKEAGIVPETSEPTTTAPQRQPDDDRATQIAAENAELRRQLAKVQAERITADATSFVKEQLAAGHAYPAEQQALAALYIRAAELDASGPRTDGQPSCVALVQAAYAARPAHHLDKNLLSPTLPAGSRVLTNDAGGEQELLDAADKSARAYAERANGKR